MQRTLSYLTSLTLLERIEIEKLKSIPLSKNTIQWQIQEMSDDIQQQTTDRVKASDYYAPQIDESVDFANSAILLVYVKHV